VRAAVENWARLGAREALTGPIARGDAATVARQRAAVAERAPDLLALFDAMADATAALARGERGAALPGGTAAERGAALPGGAAAERGPAAAGAAAAPTAHNGAAP